MAEFDETQFVQEENSTESHQLRASVFGDDDFRFELAPESNDGVIVVEQDGSFRFAEAPDFENSLNDDNVYSFTVVATSNNDPGIMVTQEIELAVTDLAEFDETQFVQEENSTESHQLRASVFGDDNFRFELAPESNDGVIVVEQDGSFRFAEAPDFENSLNVDNVYSFTVVATSNNDPDIMAPQEIELAVTDVAELVAVRDGFRRLTSAQETAIISIDGLLENSGDIDSNVDDFRFQIVDGPTSGMATVNEGFVEFTPFEGFEGTDLSLIHI